MAESTFDGKTIKYGGVTYTIRLEDDPVSFQDHGNGTVSGDKLSGYVDTHSMEIILKRVPSAQSQLITLLHELSHVMAEHGGVHRGMDEEYSAFFEVAIECWSYGTLHLLRENPWLLDEIGNNG